MGSYHSHNRSDDVPVVKKPAYGRMPLPLWFVKPLLMLANLIVIFSLVAVVTTVLPGKQKPGPYNVTTPKAR